MMHHLLVFWVLLFDVRHAGIQAQSVIWKFPTANNPLQANRGDTVLLDYTSTLSNTILRMWCTPKGGNQSLASSFYVNSDGPFSYVLATYASDETGFPLGCHAELASDPLGDGTDSPAGITFSSNSAQAAKTVSQSQAAASSIVTTTLAGPTMFITTNGQGATTSSANTNSLSQSTTAALSTTTSSGSPSGAPAASQSSASPPASSSSSNTGAIVGGVIGGLALLSFIVLALLFLRRYRRNHADAPPAPTATKPSRPGFSLFGFYQKRGGKLSTANVHEKDGSPLPQSQQVHEVPGSTAAFELPAGSNRLP